MKFVTSYYAKIAKIREEYPDYVIVSISGGLDDYILPLVDIWDKRLAPKKDFFNEYKSSNPGLERERKYVKEFQNKVLIRDDGITLNDILKSWSDRGGLNKTFVIMCYEVPEDFCHRHIVAEAIEQKYGVKIPELFLFDDYERVNYKYRIKSNFDEDEW
jgi:hypothetical protein